MFLLFAKFHNKFCSTIIANRVKNPFIHLNPTQLAPMIKLKISQPVESIQDINALIDLSLASHHHKMFSEMNRLNKKCMDELENIHGKINQFKEQELVHFQLGSLISIMNNHLQQLNQKWAEKITMMYLNTYSHIFPFRKHLEVYENSELNPYLDLIKSAAFHRINLAKSYQKFSLQEYIAYLRLFHNRFNSQQINQELEKFVGTSNPHGISQQEKLTLSYLSILSGSNYQLINRLNLQPNLEIKPKQNPKWICIKLQIIKYLQNNIPQLDAIDLSHWDYNHLIWISQFVGNNNNVQLFKKELHEKIMKSELPKNIKPNTIFTYINHVPLLSHNHIQISYWLSKQKNIGSEHEENLCQMLIEIHEKKCGVFYHEFYKLILKMSLGNFKWESQNIIYYFGQIWKVQDENMEYLRRYILNTYASLGTARRQIPTSSYFYKILEVTNVEKFYGNL